MTEKLITLKDIPEDPHKTFLKWMQGQTARLIDGVQHFYEHDYNRFLVDYAGQKGLFNKKRQ